MKSTIIKRAFRKAFQKFGEDSFQRIERKIPHCVSFWTYNLNMYIEPRSKELVVGFLRQMMRARQLKLKTMQYYTRLRGVQKGFSRYIKHTRYKTHILKTIFTEYKEAMRMKAINDKNQELVDQLGNITQATMDLVIKRYVIYCKEQA